MKIITICIIVCSALTCKNTDNAITSKKQNSNSITGDYTITHINNQTTPLDGLTISFNEKDSSVSGYSGCNRFTGSFEKNGNTIKIGPLASTRMACDSIRNEIEQDILEVLNKINSVTMENGKLVLSNANSILLNALKINNNVVITYQAATRGFFEKIWINNKHITYSNDYNLKVIKQSDCPSSHWEELMKLIDEIDLNSIYGLEPPSKSNNYDAAAAATLEINIDGTSYKTPIFDHGNPPKSIEQIVNKVLSMKNLVEKQ